MWFASVHARQRAAGERAKALLKGRKIVGENPIPSSRVLLWASSSPVDQAGRTRWPGLLPTPRRAYSPTATNPVLYGNRHLWAIRAKPGRKDDLVVAAIEAKLFLSWAHADENLKKALLVDLEPALGCFSDVRFAWWEDSHLVPGETLLPGIVDRLDECDFGVLLLSGRYFGRPFIHRHELPRFVGRSADKGALPVRLAPITDRTTNPDLGGVQDLVEYAWAGKSFMELNGPGRRKFAIDCAAAIRRRVLGDNGYRWL